MSSNFSLIIFSSFFIAILSSCSHVPVDCPCKKNIEANTAISSHQKSKPVVALATSMLELLDQAKNGEFWDKASPLFKKTISKPEWIKKSNLIHDQLGNFISRTPKDIRILEDKEIGEASISYNSSFQNLPFAKEDIHLSKIKNIWQAYGVFVKPTSEFPPND